MDQIGQRVALLLAAATPAVAAQATQTWGDRSMLRRPTSVADPQVHREPAAPAHEVVAARPTAALAIPFVCGWHVAVANGQPAPGGGTFLPLAWGSSAALARSGAVAFAAAIAGDARNQGMFLFDRSGMHAIARGCGGPGGSGQSSPCGDRAPGGGTFGGFFLGGAPAPAIDDDGDVLFLADLHSGPARRGLFLFEATRAELVRVAMPGDTVTDAVGGTMVLGAVGPGCVLRLGAAGPQCSECEPTVVFVARALGSRIGEAEFFSWRGGVVRPLVRRGDAAPGGGVFTALATESLLLNDGTDLPIGPLPSLDACGRLVFRAHANGRAGLVERTDPGDGTPPRDRWLVRTGDAAPGGGTFAAFDAPTTNGRGDVAVFADIAFPAGTSAAWFVGAAGAWRRALGFFDPIDGGQCLGLAVSRGPMTPLDGDGHLVLWTDLALAGGADRIVDVGPDGSVQVLARRGDPAPSGGMFGSLAAWPTRVETGQVLVSAAIAGGQAADAHLVIEPCAPRVAVAACAPIGHAVRVADRGARGEAIVLVASLRLADVQLAPFGALRLVAPFLLVQSPTLCAGGPWADATLLRVPDDPAFAGLTVHFQALVFDSSGLLRTTNLASVLLR